MTKTEKELKKEFSAYVKTAIKNTQKQYLIKKGKILDNEIAMDDEGIDEILQKQTEDLFDKMDLNVDMVLSDEINVNSFLDQINDPVLYVSLCSLKELQQKVLMLRIVYVKSFDDIGGILNMTAKQAENSYYNAIRKIRKQISKREAVNAVVELEKIGVVRRVFRTVRKGGMRNSNVLFLELNVDVLIQLTYPENLSDAGYHFLKGELSPHKERGATSGCDRISQSNEAYLSFEGDTNTEITEENTDIEYPLCSYQAVERAIRIQISYDALKNDHPYDRRVEEILGLILDVMVSTAPKLRINREEKDIEIVKAQFAKLTKDHVEFVLQSMDDTSTKARNIRAVLLTALYNSVNTINSYYGNRYHFHLAEETRREMEETD